MGYPYIVRNNVGGYNNGAYYLYKVYTFSNAQKAGQNNVINDQAMISSYCGAYSYDQNNKKIVYGAANTFGYINLTEDTNKSEGGDITHNNYM